MFIKKFNPIFVIFVLILFFGGCEDSLKNKKNVEINDVVATVNGVDIKEDFVDKTYNMWLFMKGLNEKKETLNSDSEVKEKEEIFHYGRREKSIIKTNILKMKVQGIVLEKYYKDLDRTINDKDLENKYAEMMGIMKEKKPDVLKFYKDNKIDKDFIKDGVKNNYYLTEFMEDLDKKYKEEYDLSEKDYKNFKLSVNPRIILLDNKKIADEVYKKIQAGEKFEKLVSEYSLDEASKVRNGEMGNTKLEELPIEFSKNIMNLKKDEVTKPFKTIFGYNIVKLIDYKTIEDMLKDEELSDTEEANTKSIVYNRYFQIKWYDEMNKLVKNADVKIIKDYYKEDSKKISKKEDSK